MAGNRIKGITIEIGGDSTKLQKALQSVDKDLRATESNLKDVNKLLKLDPKNTELLTQKQKNLEKAVKLTKERLEKLRDAQSQVQEGSEEWDALQREIIDTEKKLEGLEKEYKEFGSVGTQQVKAVGQQLQDAGQKIEDFGQKLAPVSAAAGALGAGLVKLGYDAVTNADDLNTLAMQTGLTTAEIQKMQYASDLIEVSFDDIAGALRKMKANMDGHPETWERLGVAVTDADGNVRDATDVFYDVVEALGKVENETERDQLAMDLFGKSADSLAGIVDDGGQALKEYGQQAEDLGLILEQDTIDKLNRTNDTIDQLKANIGGTLAQIGADVAEVLAPGLEKAAGAVGKITEALRELGPEQTAAILAVVGVVAVLAPVIITIGQLVAAIGAITTVLAPVIAAIGAFAAAFGAPVLAIGVAIAAMVALVKNHAVLEQKTNELAANIAAKWDSIKNSAAEKWNAIKTTVVNTAEGIRSAAAQKFEAVKKAITDPIDKAKQKVQDGINSIKNTINNVKLSLPHFKLPHFRISGGTPPYGLGGAGTKPSFSVDWYKRAYENPVVFTEPTVLPTMAGYKGFGDGSGAEIVMGLDKLREVVGAAGGDVININVYAAPGMDTRAVANEVQRVLAQAQRQKGAVYA